MLGITTRCSQLQCPLAGTCARMRTINPKRVVSPPYGDQGCGQYRPPPVDEMDAQSVARDGTEGKGRAA